MKRPDWIPPHIEETNEPLLVIKLDDETAVPKVFYNGKQINHLVHVGIDWDTDTELLGGLTYAIEHVVTDEGYPVTNRIERRVKGHATD